MQVRMRTTMAGPMGTYHAGDVVDFSAGLAEALIAGGYADAATTAGVAAPVGEVPETAALQPGSQAAVLPKGRHKRG